MSGSRRKTAYALLAALTAALIAALAALPALLCGCSVAAPQTSPPAHFRDKEFDFDHEPQAIVRHPLSVITKRAEVKNCVILYPYVLDSGMGTLNLSVFNAFEELVGKAAHKLFPTFNDLNFIEINQGFVVAKHLGVTIENQTKFRGRHIADALVLKVDVKTILNGDFSCGNALLHVLYH